MGELPDLLKKIKGLKAKSAITELLKLGGVDALVEHGHNLSGGINAHTADVIAALIKDGGVDALIEYSQKRKVPNDGNKALADREERKKIDVAIKDAQVDEFISSIPTRRFTLGLENIIGKLKKINGVDALKRYTTMQDRQNKLLDEALKNAEILQNNYNSERKKAEANDTKIKSLQVEIEQGLNAIANVQTPSVGALKIGEAVLDEALSGPPDAPPLGGPPEALGAPPAPPDAPGAPPGPPPSLGNPPVFPVKPSTQGKPGLTMQEQLAARQAAREAKQDPAKPPAKISSVAKQEKTASPENKDNVSAAPKSVKELLEEQLGKGNVPAGPTLALLKLSGLSPEDNLRTANKLKEERMQKIKTARAFTAELIENERALIEKQAGLILVLETEKTQLEELQKSTDVQVKALAEKIAALPTEEALRKKQEALQPKTEVPQAPSDAPDAPPLSSMGPASVFQGPQRKPGLTMVEELAAKKAAIAAKAESAKPSTEASSSDPATSAKKPAMSAKQEMELVTTKRKNDLEDKEIINFLATKAKEHPIYVLLKGKFPSVKSKIDEAIITNVKAEYLKNGDIASTLKVDTLKRSVALKGLASIAEELRKTKAGSLGISIAYAALSLTEKDKIREFYEKEKEKLDAEVRKEKDAKTAADTAQTVQDARDKIERDLGVVALELVPAQKEQSHVASLQTTILQDIRTVENDLSKHSSFSEKLAKAKAEAAKKLLEAEANIEQEKESRVVEIARKTAIEMPNIAKADEIKPLEAAMPISDPAAAQPIAEPIVVAVAQPTAVEPVSASASASTAVHKAEEVVEVPKLKAVEGTEMSVQQPGVAPITPLSQSEAEIVQQELLEKYTAQGSGETLKLEALRDILNDTDAKDIKDSGVTVLADYVNQYLPGKPLNVKVEGNTRITKAGKTILEQLAKEKPVQSVTAGPVSTTKVPDEQAEKNQINSTLNAIRSAVIAHTTQHKKSQKKTGFSFSLFRRFLHERTDKGHTDMEALLREIELALKSNDLGTKYDIIKPVLRLREQNKTELTGKLSSINQRAEILSAAAEKLGEIIPPERKATLEEKHLKQLAEILLKVHVPSGTPKNV